MRLFCSIFLVLFTSGSILSQERVVLTVYDGVTNTPISNVNVLSDKEFYLGKTNEIGEFKFKESYSGEVILNHISYEQKRARISGEDMRVNLTPKLELLKGVEITANAPEVVYKDETYHASHYEFLDQNNLLILTYEKKRMFKKEEQADLEILERCKIICLDENLKVKTESRIIPEAIEITQDQYGQCFLTSTQNIYFLMITDHGIILDEMPEDFALNKNKGLILDKGKDIQLVSDFDESYPEFSYYMVNKEQEADKVVTIQDEELMHLFRAQYRNFQPREKLEAYRMELRTGIDKEVISGYMSGFHKSIYFDPIYAPAFKLDSGFVIFNHVNNSIETYTAAGEFVRSTQISYHLKPRKTGWTNKLVQDRVTNEIYACFELQGNASLKKVNLLTGELEDAIDLTYRYPEQIGLLNGEVYYLYRPFGSSQKKYLYKEGTPELDYLAN